MKLALGTAQFGLSYGIANGTGQVSRVEAKKIFDFAVFQGIDTIDTAIAYGDSEACLGELGVSDMKVVTKLPPLPDLYDDVKQWDSPQVLESIGRLGCHKIYALMLHRSSDLLGSSGKQLYRAMSRLKEDHLVNKIGVSIYSPVELETIWSRFTLDIVQAPFNIIDQRILTTGWLHRLQNEGVELHTRSSFLQGLLLIPRKSIPLKFSKWNALWDRWSDWMIKSDISAAKVCLDFVQSFNQIERIVVGADNLVQFYQVVSLANEPPRLEFPNIICDDEKLINPVNWSSL